jgi:hypothetical protein
MEKVKTALLNRPATSMREKPDSRSGKPCHDETVLPAKSRQQPGPVSHSVNKQSKQMKCSDLQQNLPLYAFGATVDGANDKLKAHLESCPLCRQQYFEFRKIKNGLEHLRRPKITAELRNSIKQNLRAEIRSSQKAWLPFSRDIREWLLMSFMPYSVGVCTSLLVAIAFIAMMFSGMLRPGNVPAAKKSGPALLASNRSPFDVNSGADISPSEFANERLGLGEESPSVNPKGALVALTRSLVRGGMKDDEVVVVADVFGNGLAQIAEVVEPSRDPRAVAELAKALDSDPAYAPFVPISLEDRPESVRVVLRFQSVNVNTGARRHTR